MKVDKIQSVYRKNAQKPPLTEGKVSTGVGVMSKMMCLRNDVVPAEQMMCLRKDVPLRGNGGGGCRRSGG